MRLIWICIFFFLISEILAQNYWAKKEAGANVDETLGVTGDNNGNTYTTGYFSGTATIDGVQKSVNGLTDIYISKTSAAGANEWVVSAGGSSSDRGLGIAVDNSGNVIVCGFFAGTINFGGGISISSNSNSQDAFVAKYSSTGVIIWAKSGGSSGGSDRANALAVDNSGNVFITGQFTGSANFGSLNIASLDNTIDAFIAKYDSNGNEVWIKKGSGSAVDRGLSIATDNSGSVYAVGQFSNDITFDNVYSNSILNAFFLIKYSNSGNEEWFRFAGGSEQSIANSVTSDGTNIYITGDYGGALTFLGSGSTTINSGYSNSVFIAAYASSGSLIWTESQGSSSAVSSRTISTRNGEIGIAGWHECTFESLSEEYGESTFNSLGFKDIFVMRYSSSGTFDYARNIGSRSDEIATSIHILPDGKEVITGVFTEQLFVPVGASPVDGLTGVGASPNPFLTYCGDSNYGNFGYLSSPISNDEDGFTLKAIDPNRAPLDIYKRYGSGCDLSIPEACISDSPVPGSYNCVDELIGCSPYNVYAVNFVPTSSSLGYFSSYTWSPSSNGSSFIVTQPGTITVEISSQDGCYSSFATVDVDVYPPAQEPLLSDNAGVNTLASNPGPIIICPGETVDLWCQFPADYSYYWTGPGIASSDQTNNETVTVSQQGSYYFHVVSPDGCEETVSVNLFIEDLPPEELNPYFQFQTVGDTVVVCGFAGSSVTVWDEITDEGVPYNFYDFTWSISEPGSIAGNGTSVSLSFPENGWYIITVDIESEKNPCIDVAQTFQVIDSVYAVLRPVPDVSFTLTGPSFTCPGDTITLYSDYSDGTPNYLFDVIEDFGDSLYVSGSGNYIANVMVTNEYGCSASEVQSLYISEAQTPAISSLPEISVICPGDSVLLYTQSPGDIIWQGPSGNSGNNDSLYVQDAGLYFAEVTFYEGCALVSNTIEVIEFSTPYIEGSGGVLCDGDTLEISVVSSAITDIVWQEPLFGSDITQLITSPGIYTVQVTACDIVAEISIEVIANTNTVSISQPDLSPVCEGDSILLAADPDNYPQYNWTNSSEGADIYVHNSGSIQVEALDEFGCELVSNVLNIEFEPIPPLPVYDYDLVCEGDLQIIDIESDGHTINFIDGFGGPLVSNDSQIIIPNFVGDTTLYLYLNSEFCIGPADSLYLFPKLYPENPILSTDAPVCTGTTLNLVVLNAADEVTYSWLSPKGNTYTGGDVNIGVSSLEDAGIYYCYANLENCLSDTVGIPIELFLTRQIVLPPDTNMCFRANFSIVADSSFQTYLWQDGSTNSYFSPTETTEIILSATDENNCRSVDFMQINIVDCSIDIPNVFTPNGDGYNDSWIAFTEAPLFYEIIVYNRWGRVMFKSNSVLNNWNGDNYKSNEPCSEGVYYYILRLNNFEGSPFEQTGTITLLRD